MIVTDTWILDTSPLIGFAKIGRLDLLTAPGRVVLIPETVAREVEAGPAGDPARLALAGGWGTRVSAVPVPPGVVAWQLDAGEEAALALALIRPGAAAILDDTDARRAARALSVPVIGTTGVLLRARQAGRIGAVVPLLRALRAVGLFLPYDHILQAALGPYGETWP